MPEHAQEPSRPLHGRLALVTGAGRGIGKAVALDLAAAGATVALLSRTASQLEEVASAIRAAGGSAQTIVCDVCKDGQVQDAVHSLPRLDILVNNAGGNRPANFVDVTPGDLDDMLELNVRSAFVMAQAAVRKMLTTPIAERMPGGSSIVHMTSQMGRVGGPKRTVYCMTKHAVEGLNKAMAIELAPQGIRVNAVAPTFLDTELTRPFFDADPAFAQWVLSRIPLGRLGTVDEVARLVTFLASPSASLITGESIAADGGYTAQ